MAISLNQLVRAAQPKLPIMTVYGVHGIGKSTFAAQAPSPVFIQTEDGLGMLDCAHFPLAASFDDVIGALAALYTEPHDFKTCVIDSVDWLEALIWAKVCRDNGWASIEDAGYGKGYVAALNLWRQYLDGLNALRDVKGMSVVQIAHTDIKRFDSPEHDPYDRYVIKLHARAAALLQEHSDIVLFANYRISTVKATSASTRRSPGRSALASGCCTPANARPSSPRTATACPTPCRSTGQPSPRPCLKRFVRCSCRLPPPPKLFKENPHGCFCTNLRCRQR